MRTYAQPPPKMQRSVQLAGPHRQGSNLNRNSAPSNTELAVAHSGAAGDMVEAEALDLGGVVETAIGHVSDGAVPGKGEAITSPQCAAQSACPRTSAQAHAPSPPSATKKQEDDLFIQLVNRTERSPASGATRRRESSVPFMRWPAAETTICKSRTDPEAHVVGLLRPRSAPVAEPGTGRKRFRTTLALA